MQTTFQSRSVQIKTVKTETAHKTVWSKLLEKAEANRFGVIPYLLMFLGCMGGIAAAFGAENSAFELAAVVFPTILALAFMLAVSPMKLIISISIVSLILDLLVLFI